MNDNTHRSAEHLYSTFHNPDFWKSATQSDLDDFFNLISEWYLEIKPTSISELMSNPVGWRYEFILIWGALLCNDSLGHELIAHKLLSFGTFRTTSIPVLLLDDQQLFSKLRAAVQRELHHLKAHSNLVTLENSMIHWGIKALSYSSEYRTQTSSLQRELKVIFHSCPGSGWFDYELVFDVSSLSALLAHIAPKIRPHLSRSI